MGAPDPDHVQFRSVTYPDLTLSVELGEDPVTPTGYPVWDTLARPTAATPAGRPPLALAIPLMFDGWRHQKSVEPAIRKLERLLGLGEPKPMLLRIEGDAIPHSYGRDPSLRWANNGDPTYGEIRLLPDGDRCFAQITVTVIEIPEATTADPANPRRLTFKVPSAGPLNTLRRIAKFHTLSTRAVQQLNPLLPHDPDHHLKAGTQVRLA